MRFVAFAFALLSLSACAGTETPASANALAPAPRENVALPPAASAEPASVAATEQVVTTCKVDADCAVKNVGSCCGYFPACVNKDSPTFPDRVKADCAAKGMNSVCGFQEPSGCACVSGECASTGTSLVPGEPQ